MNEYEKYKSQYDASRGKEKEQLLAPLQREIESLRSQSDYTVDVERGRLIDKSGVEWFIIPNTLNITVDEFFEYGKPEWVAQMQAKIESLRAELEYAKREAIRWNDEAVKIKRERDEARKEREYWRDQHRNEESLADSLREERDEARQAIDEWKKLLRQADAQYDTAQPTAPSVIPKFSGEGCYMFDLSPNKNMEIECVARIEDNMIRFKITEIDLKRMLASIRLRKARKFDTAQGEDESE